MKWLEILITELDKAAGLWVTKLEDPEEEEGEDESEGNFFITKQFFKWWNKEGSMNCFDSPLLLTISTYLLSQSTAWVK